MTGSVMDRVTGVAKNARFDGVRDGPRRPEDTAVRLYGGIWLTGSSRPGERAGWAMALPRHAKAGLGMAQLDSSTMGLLQSPPPVTDGSKRYVTAD